ncbi:hypothetical protein L9F63_000021, partial [Diploptera punctata]
EKHFMYVLTPASINHLEPLKIIKLKGSLQKGVFLDIVLQTPNISESGAFVNRSKLITSIYNILFYYKTIYLLLHPLTSRINTSVRQLRARQILQTLPTDSPKKVEG